MKNIPYKSVIGSLMHAMVVQGSTLHMPPVLLANSLQIRVKSIDKR